MYTSSRCEATRESVNDGVAVTGAGSACLECHLGRRTRSKHAVGTFMWTGDECKERAMMHDMRPSKHCDLQAECNPAEDVQILLSMAACLSAGKGSIYDLPCNHNCGCSEDVVDPVCSADNRMFLSPCYAGCQVQLYDGNTLAYAACACVNGSMPAAGLPVQAVPSRCPQKCAYLAVYVMGLFVCMTAVFLNVAPSTAATIRVVRPKERSLALGVRVIITRLFGTIPAPVVFGSIVDRSCQTWNHRCGEVGNCLAYQNGRMAHSLLLALLACMTASAICYTIAAFFVHRKSSSTAIKQYPEASYQE